ncbi:MAG: Holliday junction branch migration protein RuvA [Ignavibacteriaceae bacterium]
MIGYLKGKISALKPTSLILDVNGVGYRVNISINTFDKIADLRETELFIHTNVKEDAITLYGFFDEGEKEMFELLISVNGIGPRLALSLLSGIRTDELKNAIEKNDLGRIVAVPGIGRKTAERLVLELRSKVESVSTSGLSAEEFSIKNQAVSALTTLGYNNKIADKVIRDVLSLKPQITLEDLIKEALANLNR